MERHLNIKRMLESQGVIIEIPEYFKYLTDCPICKSEQRFFTETTFIDSINSHCDTISLKNKSRKCCDCEENSDRWRVCPVELAISGKKVMRFRCQKCHDIVEECSKKIPYTNRFNPHAPVWT